MPKLEDVTIDTTDDIVALAKKELQDNYTQNKKHAVCTIIERIQSIDACIARLQRNRAKMEGFVEELQQANTLTAVRKAYDKVREYDCFNIGLDGKPEK